jgi:tetratricopeptide (TPR) repeat protein
MRKPYRKRSSGRGSDRRTRHRNWMAGLRGRIALVSFGIVVLVVAIAALEVALRLRHYGEAHTRPDPFVGFERVHRLFHRSENELGDQVYTTCSNRLTFFNQQRFAANKRAGTYRIFCLGGSSTYGRPYRWETAYPRWLELILDSTGSDLDFEVINAGGISYASYRVCNLVAEITEGCYEPDLLVIHCGHNEFLENRTYGEFAEGWGRKRAVRLYLDRLRSACLLRQAIRSLRGHSEAPPGRPLMDEEVDAILDRSAGLDSYVRDDALCENILRHYECSMERMVEAARTRGVAVVFVNMVSNLKDFAPFKSAPRKRLTPPERERWDSLYCLGCRQAETGRWREALDLLIPAARIDEGDAALQFKIARCHEALGNSVAAESCYILAKDEDICPLRAPERINAAMARVAGRYDVPLVDARSRLREAACRRTGCPIPGDEFFLDHIHLTIEGHQLMARWIAETLVQEGLVGLPGLCDTAALRPAFDKALSELDAEYMAQRHLNLGKVLSWAGRENEAARHFALAAKMMTGNAEVHYRMGHTHKEAGRIRDAVAEFEEALNINPEYAAAHNDLGLCLLKMGLIRDAEMHFRAAMALRPDQAMPHLGIGRCHLTRGALDQAISEYERAVAIQPDYAEGLSCLGVAYQDAGRYADSQRLLLRLVELYPDFAEAHLNLGSLFMAVGRTTEAEAELRCALHIQPNLYQAYGNLGIVYLMMGDRTTAASMFRKVLDLNPGDENAEHFLRKLGGKEPATAPDIVLDR